MIASILCGTWLCLGAASDGTGPLLIEHVLAAVERDFPLVEGARRDRDVAEGEKLAAAGGFDPVVRARAEGVPIGYYRSARVDVVAEQPTPLWGTSVFAGWRLGAGSFAPYYGEYVTGSLGEVRAGIQVPVLRNGPIDRRRAAVQRADAGLKMAEQGVEQQLLDSSRGAAHRYWDWVAAGQRFQIARHLLEIAQQRDTQLAARAARGEIPPIELLDNQRAIVQREGQLVATERGLQQASIELSLYWRDEAGRPQLPRPTHLPNGLPEFALSQDEPGAVGRALAQRPDIRRLEAQRAQLVVDRTFAQNQVLPAVDVTVTAAKDFGAIDSTRRPPELAIGVSVELPVLYRAPLGREQSAAQTVARFDQQLRLARDRAHAEVRDALSALAAAHRRLGAARNEVRLARELERAERSKFELGESTLLFVNLREQAAAEAELREVDALLEGQRADVALRTATADGWTRSRGSAASDVAR